MRQAPATIDAANNLKAKRAIKRLPESYRLDAILFSFVRSISRVNQEPERKPLIHVPFNNGFAFADVTND